MTEPSDGAAVPPARPRTRWWRWVVPLVAASAIVALLVWRQVADDEPSPATEEEVAASEGAAASPAPSEAAGGEWPLVGIPGCGGPERASTVPIDGFGEVAFQVTAPDGTTAFNGCAHLADTPELRAQGLMGQPSLRGYEAMVFRFDEPSSGSFYMYRTTLPLSIAYISADGSVVSTADMDPCADEVASACLSYAADGPYLHAIEVEQGGLARIGVVPGATVTFGETPAS